MFDVLDFYRMNGLVTNGATLCLDKNKKPFIIAGTVYTRKEDLSEFSVLEENTTDMIVRFTSESYKYGHLANVPFYKKGEFTNEELMKNTFQALLLLLELDATFLKHVDGFDYEKFINNLKGDNE